MTLIEPAGRTNGQAHTLSWKEPAANLWAEAAPRRVRKRYSHRAAPGGWREWQRWLAGRRRPRRLASRSSRKHSPLAWALPRECSDSGLRATIDLLWQIELGKRPAKAGREKMKLARRKPQAAEQKLATAGHDSPAPDAALAAQLHEWTDLDPAPVGAAYAIEALAWARALPALAARLDESTWWALWDKLADLARPESAAPGLAAPADENLLARALLSAELPLTLAYLFPELAQAAELGLAGWRSARAALEEHVLGDGFVSSRLWDACRPLFASWTRTWTFARWLERRAARNGKSKAAATDNGADDERAAGTAATAESASDETTAGDASTATDAPADVDARREGDAPCEGESQRSARSRRALDPQKKPFARPRQYERLLTTTLRLCRPDGSQMLSPGAAAPWSRPLFAAARRLIRRSPAARALQVAKPGRRAAKNTGQSKKRKKAAPGRALCESAAHGETAQAAILRPNWRRDSPRLAVAYDDGVTRLELLAAGRSLLAGEWSLELMVSDEPAMSGARWEEICWVSDSDVDYLEIEAKLAGGLRVQRQMLLARQDRFLLLADGVMAPAAAPIDYSASLRLAPDVAFRPAGETCEGRLVAGKSRFNVLPLALPEWRSAFFGGELSESDGALRLRQQAHGAGLFAPLFFDLDPGRSREPLTWRRLTVGEGLRALADDVAVGYRAQIGKRQWLVYRSLAPRAARSVLGQHLASEFMTGRFHRSGQVDRLVEVETE